MSSTDRQPNRLGNETSPYLQQHAYNPVDWYPWGEEAIARAKELDRPIFLSIGYSACHWCHVMEHESFENDDIATFMNEHFVCIKVDREERPDLDQIYMNSVTLLTGRGGWPMSVFMTTDLKPFYGGTYWPPQARMGMPGFAQILEGVHNAWIDKRTEVNGQADELTNAIARVSGISVESVGLNHEELLTSAQASLLQAADTTNGGFGDAPKFPHPMSIRLLLRCWKRTGNAEALSTVTHTLDRMAGGGIYDHLGGGFARYSTDARWLAPHFEKMLYDNALLVPAYLEGFQATRNADYARVAKETLDYVLREMTQAEGGFYATQDADSEGEEGKFFVWSEAEVLELLGSEDGRIFCYCYDVSAPGNWEGKNILNRPKLHDDAARVLKIDADELSQLLARCRAKLFDVRSKRIWPGRDDKVLASWNGMMISAISQGAMILDDPKYAAAASKAADFILDRMREPDGRLLHSFKDGRARFNGYLDDYACLIDGLIDLFQATGETSRLTSALELAERVVSQFEDTADGGFFYTSSDHEELITRAKDSQDNATPSGNGMAAYTLLRLGRLCSRTDLEEKAVATLEVLSGQMAQHALSSSQSLLAADFLIGPAWELVLVDGEDPAASSAARRTLSETFLANRLIVPVGDSTSESESPISALTADRPAVNGEPTLYACRQGACQAPVTGVAAIVAAIADLA
jgi:uncharacterized protein YyaL (SSP411 family)